MFLSIQSQVDHAKYKCKCVKTQLIGLLYSVNVHENQCVRKSHTIPPTLSTDKSLWDVYEIAPKPGMYNLLFCTKVHRLLFTHLFFSLV